MQQTHSTPNKIKFITTLTLILWIILILFLSFQTGEDTADTSREITYQFLKLLTQGEVSEETILHWDGYIRLVAHPVLFFNMEFWQ